MTVGDIVLVGTTSVAIWLPVDNTAMVLDISTSVKCIVVDGILCTVVDGISCTVVDGISCTVVDGISCTVVDGIVIENSVKVAMTSS